MRLFLNLTAKIFASPLLVGRFSWKSPCFSGEYSIAQTTLVEKQVIRFNRSRRIAGVVRRTLVTFTIKHLVLFWVSIAAIASSPAHVHAAVVFSEEPTPTARITTTRTFGTVKSVDFLLTFGPSEEEAKDAVSLSSMDFNESTLAHTVSWQVAVTNESLLAANEDLKDVGPSMFETCGIDLTSIGAPMGGASMDSVRGLDSNADLDAFYVDSWRRQSFRREENWPL